MFWTAVLECVNIVRNDQESRQKSVPDPDPEIRSYKGVVPVLQIIFSVLWALVWSKNKGAPSPASPLEMQQRKLSCPQELRSTATKLTCHIVVCSSKHDPAYDSFFYLGLSSGSRCFARHRPGLRDTEHCYYQWWFPGHSESCQLS